eukprot:7419876-Alexandrium_andersonii.AAC.1
MSRCPPVLAHGAAPILGQLRGAPNEPLPLPSPTGRVDQSGAAFAPTSPEMRRLTTGGQSPDHWLK